MANNPLMFMQYNIKIQTSRQTHKKKRKKQQKTKAKKNVQLPVLLVICLHDAL